MKSTTLVLLLLLLSSFSLAQKKKSSSVEPVFASSLASKISGMKKFEGFVEFCFDEKQDKIFLLIEKFNTEFLYVNSLSAGIGSNDIGLDRGQLGNERIVKFERRGPKVLLTEPNYQYRAITQNADERRAVEEAFAQSVLWGFKVEEEDNGKVLVDATDFFMQDAHGVTERLKAMQQGTYSLDKSRSAFYPERIKNFPQNSEFDVTLTFTGQATGSLIQSVTPTSSSVTVRQHHSFVQLPDDGYKPRKFDPRAGYFSLSYYDYATPINEPVQKLFIHRHRLKKKDPSAAVSEAVKPIVYYLDRGTPEPVRSALLDGARWWNQAFEAAGYKDAFRVEMLPEDADPMDVRYNVIQWVHRSTRGWSYGASVADPRTGEIIKGHVSLGSLRVRQDFLIAEGLLAPYETGKPLSTQMEEMALARLRQLAAHEVGHTLGLAHSYSSSTEGLASVMDYPHPVATIKDGKIDLAQAYDDKIGAWDKVAIAYGYQHFPEGTNEDQALLDMIQKSINEGLTFLSDQDARPAGGAHPAAHLWDNGKDVVEELNRVLEIRSIALKNFGENNIKPGTPLAKLEETLVPVYFFHRYQTEAVAKLIGGLNYRYALRGDGQLITELIPPHVQQKALDALLATVKAETLILSEDIIKNIPPRPIGYNRHNEVFKIRTSLTFDPLAAVEAASELTFDLLLHPARASRLIEHHARDAKQPSLPAVIDQLVESTFKRGIKKGFEGAVQITINEVFLNNLIALALHNASSEATRGVTSLKLDQLKAWLTERLKNLTLDDHWRAHYQYALTKIGNYQKNPGDYKEPTIMIAPPGQPIGMYDLEYCGSKKGE